MDTSASNITTLPNGTHRVNFTRAGVHFVYSTSPNLIIGDSRKVAEHLRNRLSKALTSCRYGDEQKMLRRLKKTLCRRKGRPVEEDRQAEAQAIAEIDKAFRKLETKPRHE